MIRYSPIDGDVLPRKITYRPRHCFLMTKLGKPLPDDIQRMRRTFERYAEQHKINIIDANSVTTGKDFLLKICDLIASVPLGVAIISEELPIPTMCNIYYELGLLQALGKETLIIKSKNCPIPSDFVRTEYIEYSRKTGRKLGEFFSTFFELAEHYAQMAEGLKQNPALAIDYLRRAFLISNKNEYRDKAKDLFKGSTFDAQRTASIDHFLNG